MPLKFFAKYLPKEKVIGDKTVFATRGTLKWSENVSNKINYTPIQFAISNPGNPLQFFFLRVKRMKLLPMRENCVLQTLHPLFFHLIKITTI